ncbi:MAG: DUF4157 domain-containing protein [Proteobacteria bacterium]|nr:DUF4157 domain-containing protein [Pseudomonadota bacterium]
MFASSLSHRPGSTAPTIFPVAVLQRSVTAPVGEKRSDFVPRIASLERAATEPSQPLAGPVSAALQRRFDHDFSAVRVHAGPHSVTAAHHLNARAYTLGTDIHLGAEAIELGGEGRNRLLAHEAVHAMQQGGTRVAPNPGLPVGDPYDDAEREAEAIADSLQFGGTPMPKSSPRGNAGHALSATLQRRTPRVQRDLSGKHPVREGEFDLNLKVEKHPDAKSGMSGTIKFKANEKALDSTSIRLLQVVRTEDMSTGKDLTWHGGEANRNKVMTAEDKSRGVGGGAFVDKLHANLNRRTRKTDKAASPYYIDDYPGTQTQGNKDGSKKGKTVSEASLWDYPGSTEKIRFSFETVAVAADTGHTYGTVMWGFETTAPDKGEVSKERAVGRNVTLLTTDKAIEKFNDFYRNPGTSQAPK